MSALPAAPISARPWFGKVSAAVVLGYTLSIGLSGLFAWHGPGGIDAGPGKVQFNMWMLAPPWVAVLSTCFLFRSGLRAWLWLAAANALVFGVQLGARAFGG